jgi:alkanesulfonate monooxygenase SsuD/methylene tetrahydromethanopterin reductase-like flavin-dependent oxidoreductase (luciferase family)
VHPADELGFDVFAAPDHLRSLAPFAALAAAGMVSARLRLRTYVLNAGFRNPALSREVATLDVLSGGRAELGLGAGRIKREHDDARLPWAPQQHGYSSARTQWRRSSRLWQAHGRSGRTCSPRGAGAAGRRRSGSGDRGSTRPLVEATRTPVGFQDVKPARAGASPAGNVHGSREQDRGHPRSPVRGDDEQARRAGKSCCCRCGASSSGTR